MDRYKFRGKPVEAKVFGTDFVHGDLIQRGRKRYILPTVTICAWSPEGELTTTPIEVHPESVGQYTGLKDKNGVDDYAGNIWEVEYDGKKYRYVREVECEWEGYKFDFTNINHNLSPVHSDVSELGEIIGTIHGDKQWLYPTQ